MSEEELLLMDRIGVIRSADEKYDLENNAYLSFSGGKDSTILHYLLDMALPGNRIPRVFVDTGIEYNAIRKFVVELSKTDSRFHLIKPSVPIGKMLRDDGYPFKSKEFSGRVAIYKKNADVIDGFKDMSTEELKSFMLANREYEKSLIGKGIFLIYYLHDIRAKRDGDGYVVSYDDASKFSHPKSLEFMFDGGYPLKVSSLCCQRLKKEPAHRWERESGRHIVMTGMKREEGGQRSNIKGCVLTDKNGNVRKFHPLLVVSDEWEDWFVRSNGVELCELYKPPFDFRRTGCKGCPYSLDLQKQLDVMETLLPSEKKQCEVIWKPVYDEYRRLGFRLRKPKPFGHRGLFDL